MSAGPLGVCRWALVTSSEMTTTASSMTESGRPHARRVVHTWCRAARTACGVCSRDRWLAREAGLGCCRGSLLEGVVVFTAGLA